MIQDAGLTCVSSHFSYNEFRDTLPKAIEWAQAVGLTQMGTAKVLSVRHAMRAPANARFKSVARAPGSSSVKGRINRSGLV